MEKQDEINRMYAEKWPLINKKKPLYDIQRIEKMQKASLRNISVIKPGK